MARRIEDDTRGNQRAAIFAFVEISLLPGGRTLPKTMNVTGIMLFCEDIMALTAFYRDVVGLVADDPQPFPAQKFFRFRSECGPSLCLHSGTKPNGGRQKLMIRADDIDGLIQRLKKVKRGFRSPKPNLEGKIMFDFFDPEGNRIQVSGRTVR